MLFLKFSLLIVILLIVTEPLEMTKVVKYLLSVTTKNYSFRERHVSAKFCKFDEVCVVLPSVILQIGTEIIE